MCAHTHKYTVCSTMTQHLHSVKIIFIPKFSPKRPNTSQELPYKKVCILAYSRYSKMLNK